MPANHPLVIFGAGAMAGLFAARLVQSGQAVVLFDHWDAGIAAVQRHGIRLVQSDADPRELPVPATTGLAEIARVQWALVLVKSWQTHQAAADLGGVLAPDGRVLTLQNGLGNQETLAEVLGVERIQAGVTTWGARLLQPGLIQPTPSGAVFLGPDGQDWFDLLQPAGLNPQLTPDLARRQWIKLASNAAINPLTALWDVPNGALLTSPTARQIIQAVAAEVAAAAQAQGISLSPAELEGQTLAVAQATAANISSMLQDIRTGRPTEIEALNGAVVRAAAQAGLSVPWCAALRQLIQAKTELASAPPD